MAQRLPGLVLVAALAGLASAQPPSVHARLERNTIYAGESVVYQVSLVNCPEGARPRLDGFEDFGVSFLGTSSESRTSFDGTATRRYDLVHHLYRLVPRKSGILTVPAPVVDVEGRTIRGPALPLRVKGVEKQDYVILELRTSKARVYRQEPFTLRLDILVRALPEPNEEIDPFRLQPRRPNLNLPWAKPPAGLESDDPARWLHRYRSVRGFTVNESGGRRRPDPFDDPFFGPLFRKTTYLPRPRRVERPGLDRQPHQYYRYTLERVFKPVKAGTYLLGAATLKGEFCVDVVETRDRFTGRPRAAPRWETFFAVSPSCEVTVLEPPVEGRPPYFTGGIGRFRISARASRTKLQVGDPLDIIIYVEGRTGLEDVGPLKLAAQPEITRYFKVYDDAPTGEIKNGRKIFRHSVRPLTAAAKAFPAISFSYFDVEKRAYQTLTTDPIPLEIAEAERLNPSEVLVGKTAAGATDLSEREEGIFANITDPGRLDNEHPRPALWFGAIGGLAILYGLLALAVGIVRRRHGDPAAVRRRGAFARGRHALEAARRAGEPPAVLAGVHRAFQGLVADLRDIPAEGLTARDVGALGRALGDEEVAGELERLLARCEAAQFGASQLTAEEAAILVDEARAHLHAVARLYRKGSRARLGLASLVVVALVAGHAGAAQGARARLFLKAQERYEKATTPADFLHAAALFRQLLEAGEYRNGAVLYNLGNAYYRAGKLGHAIAAYRQAKRYLPGDDHLDANLRQALSRRVDKFPAEARSLIDHILFWTGAVPYRTQFHLTFGAAAAAFLFAVLRLVFGARRVVKPVLLAALVATLLLGAGSGLTAYRCELVTRGVLTAHQTNVLKAPHGAAAFDRPLHEGTEFVLLEERRGGGRTAWYRIRFAGRREGWIPARAAVTY